ncbi:MAG: S8 family serine peptidase [Candidatus Woesearchaeota archaeon]
MKYPIMLVLLLLVSITTASAIDMDDSKLVRSADGKERYIVYYDDGGKDNANSAIGVQSMNMNIVKSDFNDVHDDRIIGSLRYSNAHIMMLSEDEAVLMDNNPGIRVVKDGIVYAHLQDSIPLIGGDIISTKVNNNDITGVGQAVCIIDTGIDYTHDAFGNCNIRSYEVEGNIIVLDDIISSPSPYPNNYDNTWNITLEGADSIAVYFETMKLEAYYDYILIMDADHNVYQNLTEYDDNFWSVSVPGDTILIRMVTDIMKNDEGFIISKALNGTVLEVVSYDDCPRIIDGINLVANNSYPLDYHGHGTHVSGIISADNDMLGVAHDTGLLVVKALNSYGWGRDSNIIEGIYWCVNNSYYHNVSAISMSLGSKNTFNSMCDSDHPLYADAIDYAVSRNISVIISTGNDGVVGVSAPACIYNATRVASTNKDNTISSFSNRNSMVSLVAPGSAINSSDLMNSYRLRSGTSMAAPHVSGLIALLKQYYDNIGITKTTKELEQVLYDNGIMIYDAKTNRNYSRINVSATIDYVIGSIDIISPDDYHVNNTVMLEYDIIHGNGITYYDLIECGYTLNDEEYNTILGCNNITISELDNANHTIRMNATLSYQNNTITLIEYVFFEVNTNPPIINLSSIDNNSYTGQNTLLFNAYFDKPVVWCNIGTDNHNISMSVNNDERYAWYLYEDIDDGLHSFRVYCSDYVGRVGASDYYVMTVDTIPPMINIYYPESILYNHQINIINYSYYDANCDVVWWGNSTHNSSTQDCGLNWSGLIANEGSNTWTVWVRDKAGNINSSSVTFTLDTNPPIILSDGIIANNSIIHYNQSFHFSVYDEITDVDSFMYSIGDEWIIIDNNETIMPYYNLTDTTNSILLLYANDTAGNNVTLSYNYTIDLTMPEILKVGYDIMDWGEYYVPLNITLSLYDEVGSGYKRIIMVNNDVSYLLFENLSGNNHNISFYHNTTIGENNISFIVTDNAYNTALLEESLFFHGNINISLRFNEIFGDMIVDALLLDEYNNTIQGIVNTGDYDNMTLKILLEDAIIYFDNINLSMIDWYDGELSLLHNIDEINSIYYPIIGHNVTSIGINDYDNVFRQGSYDDIRVRLKGLGGNNSVVYYYNNYSTLSDYYMVDICIDANNSMPCYHVFDDDIIVYLKEFSLIVGGLDNNPPIIYGLSPNIVTSRTFTPEIITGFDVINIEGAIMNYNGVNETPVSINPINHTHNRILYDERTEYHNTTHNIRWYIMDNVGNVNDTVNISFLVYDTANPLLLNITPANNSVFHAQSLELNAVFDAPVTGYINDSNNILECTEIYNGLECIVSYASNTNKSFSLFAFDKENNTIIFPLSYTRNYEVLSDSTMGATSTTPSGGSSGISAPNPIIQESKDNEIILSESIMRFYFRNNNDSALYNDLVRNQLLKLEVIGDTSNEDIILEYHELSVIDGLEYDSYIIIGNPFVVNQRNNTNYHEYRISLMINTTEEHDSIIVRRIEDNRSIIPEYYYNNGVLHLEYVSSYYGTFGVYAPISNIVEDNNSVLEPIIDVETVKEVVEYEDVRVDSPVRMTSFIISLIAITLLMVLMIILIVRFARK